MAQRKSAVSPSQGAPRGPGKVSDAIIESLRQDIISGRLERGSRLPNERDLAAHFEVSQPTIREAVRVLDAMGLVDVRHGSGAYVRGDSGYLMAAALQTLLQIEQVSLIEALDVREMLGRESVRLACNQAVGADIEALEARLRDSGAGTAKTIEEVVDLIAGFQIAVSAAARNPLLFTIEAFLINLLLQIQVSAMRKRGAKFWAKRSLGFQEDREAIVVAIKRRDGDAAVGAMETYLEHQRSVFVSDPILKEMRLSDENAAISVADLVTEARQRLAV